jgi:hypothetical protein
MNIDDASNQLFSELQDLQEVVGTGVGQKNNSHYIIIYLTKATHSVLKKIPKSFQGNEVKTEVTGSFEFL